MPSFVFIAGRPAIDFLNTELIRDGEPLDLLATPDDLHCWLAATKLPTRVILSRADGEGPVPHGATPVHQQGMRSSFATLRKAKELRAATRRLIAHPRRKDLELLNAALARGRGSYRVELKNGAFRTRFHPDDADPLFFIASEIAAFLVSEDVSLVKRCEGANCVLLFYDTTKSHTRRWCSMAGCGNREKVARHYRRSRINR